MNGENSGIPEVIEFWFNDLTPEQWFVKDPAVDQRIRDRFLDLYWAATRNELFRWRSSAEGRLAEIIVLDQFSRNLFRNDPQAFLCDPLAQCLSLEAIAQKLDLELPIEQRSFLYMPLMHSESLLIHDVALEKFSQSGLEDQLHYEQLHRDIIKRFGRYPHRNEVLGRSSTPEELEFLQQPGSSF